MPTPRCGARRCSPRWWTSAGTPTSSTDGRTGSRPRFNEVFWDRRGWFVLGLDRDGAPIDALTTNPGHALWSGIADDDKARRYVDRMVDSDLWTGWGLRTLGVVHGGVRPVELPQRLGLAARHRPVHRRCCPLRLLGSRRPADDGALEATRHFAGRPPELFAGISRDDVPMPVAYPSSCSPQAWSSASILLLLRALLGLEPAADRSGVELTRPDLSAVPDLQPRPPRVRRSPDVRRRPRR